MLSGLAEAGRERLSPERLAAGERLASQVKIERAGDLVLRAVPPTERKETTEEAVKNFGRDFRKLPLEQKIATLVELEVVTLSQTLDAVVGLPSVIGGKVLDLLAGRGRTLAERERAERRPADHQKAASSSAEDK